MDHLPIQYVWAYVRIRGGGREGGPWKWPTMSDINAGERPIRMRRMQAVAAGAMGALLLLCARALPAQSSAANLSGIAHVAIRVSDLEQSRAFFHKLGF